MRALALTLAVLLPISASAAFQIAPRVAVGAEQVTLADLVPDAPASWTRVALGRAPRPGGERALDGAWVAQRARQVGAEGTIQVPDQVVIVRPGEEVSREEVVAAVEREVASKVDSGERVRVVSVSLPGTVAAGERELRVQVPDGDLPSPATVWVDVLVAGERVARAWARVEIFRSHPVLVLTRNVHRGETLGAQDVEVRAGEVKEGTLREPAEAVGRRVVRTLSAGAALSGRDVESVPVVARGDAVLLVARVGAVVATAPGRVLEQAGLGDTVRVENAVSGQQLAGVLRDGGVVDVVR